MQETPPLNLTSVTSSQDWQGFMDLLLLRKREVQDKAFLLLRRHDLGQEQKLSILEVLAGKVEVYDWILTGEFLNGPKKDVPPEDGGTKGKHDRRQ